jgi:hypothetical protein
MHEIERAERDARQKGQPSDRKKNAAGDRRTVVAVSRLTDQPAVPIVPTAPFPSRLVVRDRRGVALRACRHGSHRRLRRRTEYFPMGKIQKLRLVALPLGRASRSMQGVTLKRQRIPCGVCGFQFRTAYQISYSELDTRIDPSSQAASRA